MGKAERDKGARGELMLRDVLRKHGWPRAERGAQRHGSPDSPDVRHGPVGVHFECKFVESLSPRAALGQACEDAGLGETPAVAWKKSKEPWVVVLHLGAFLDLLRELELRRLME